LQGVPQGDSKLLWLDERRRAQSIVLAALGRPMPMAFLGVRILAGGLAAAARCLTGLLGAAPTCGLRVARAEESLPRSFCDKVPCRLESMIFAVEELDDGNRRDRVGRREHVDPEGSTLRFDEPSSDLARSIRWRSLFSTCLTTRSRGGGRFFPSGVFLP